MKTQGALAQAFATLGSPPLVDTTSARGQTTIDVEFDEVLRTDIQQSNDGQLEMAIVGFFTAKIFLAEWLSLLS